MEMEIPFIIAGEDEIDVDSLLENVDNWEKINKELRTFEFEFKKFKMSLALAFAESGLLENIKQALIDLAQNLPDIIQLFKDLFVVLKSFIEWIKQAFPSMFGGDKDASDKSVSSGIKEALLHPMDTAALAGESIAKLNASLERQRIESSQNMSNVFNSIFNVGSADEAISINSGNMRNASNIFKKSGQSFQGQINDSYNQLK
jgi:hypothetical protein